MNLIYASAKRAGRHLLVPAAMVVTQGHGLAEFVGHLLSLMGYKTKVSPPGPDRGIDIWRIRTTWVLRRPPSSSR